MKKIMNSIVYVILLPALIISTALLTYLHFFASNDNNLSGEWIATINMTEQVSFTALDWLQDIEAVSVSIQDMESHMQDLTIELHMTFEQTARSEGTFQCNILPESYEACKQTAYEEFASIFRELLAKRLDMSGYAGNTDDENVEALVTETFGMSTVSYLMSYAPDLLPSLEDLQAQFDGSGTYQTAQNILTRQFENGTVTTEYYIRKDFSLILSEAADSVSLGYFSDHYPIQYTLRQSKGEN